ncbi:MAG: peptide ABC transporter ATP-binding protein [bacterium]|nr:MAG: peptide ABC transporter ATP-binding protein [bacterium]
MIGKVNQTGADDPRTAFEVGYNTLVNSNSVLLEVKNLKTWFPIYSGLLSRRTGDVRAVDGVTLEIAPGETLGLVGESGCGKTTLGRSMLRLIEPTSGEVTFENENILKKDRKKMRAIRRKMQIIFQDPYASLNPRMTVGRIISEPLVIHKAAAGKELDERVAELMAQVGLSRELAKRYPHEFSGGQRQRIGIARAVALKPRFIVCDEPVSALDVSVQAQVLNLLMDLREKFNMAYLFISHDLSVVRHISDRVAVMYLGSIVEEAGSGELFKNPTHPYTEALIASLPVADPEIKARKIVRKGDPPSPANPPPGCCFHPRCPVKRRECESTPQNLKEISTTTAKGHKVACMVRAP